MLKFAIAAVVVLAAGTATVAVARPENAAQVMTGFASRLACSKVFVSGLDPKTVYAEFMQATVLVPLVVRDEVIGTIGFDVLHTQRTFSEEEIDLAQTVANLVAVRIEQARLFDAERLARQQAQRHAQDLTGLYAITRATSRSLSPKTLASTMRS